MRTHTLCSECDTHQIWCRAHAHWWPSVFRKMPYVVMEENAISLLPSYVSRFWPKVMSSLLLCCLSVKDEPSVTHRYYWQRQLNQARYVLWKRQSFNSGLTWHIGKRYIHSDRNMRVKGWYRCERHNFPPQAFEHTMTQKTFWLWWPVFHTFWKTNLSVFVCLVFLSCDCFWGRKRERCDFNDSLGDQVYRTKPEGHKRNLLFRTQSISVWPRPIHLWMHKSSLFDYWSNQLRGPRGLVESVWAQFRQTYSKLQLLNAFIFNGWRVDAFFND